DREPRHARVRAAVRAIVSNTSPELASIRPRQEEDGAGPPLSRDVPRPAQRDGDVLEVGNVVAPDLGARDTGELHDGPGGAEGARRDGVSVRVDLHRRVNEARPAAARVAPELGAGITGQLDDDGIPVDVA